MSMLDTVRCAPFAAATTRAVSCRAPAHAGAARRVLRIAAAGLIPAVGPTLAGVSSNGGATGALVDAQRTGRGLRPCAAEGSERRAVGDF
jgi:hypothetical protein